MLIFNMVLSSPIKLGQLYIFIKLHPDKCSKKEAQPRIFWVNSPRMDLLKWAANFFTIPTLNFKILHVLIIVHHKTRRIVHFNVTTNPNAEWVVQQFRNATPYGKVPK